MADLKKFLKNQERENRPIIIWYDSSDEVASKVAHQLIEEGKNYALDNRYSARWDRAQQPNQKNHTHVFLNRMEVLVVNDDGTSSHSSAPFSALPTKIQSKIVDLGLVAKANLEEATALGSEIIPKKLFLQLWLHLLVAPS